MQMIYIDSDGNARHTGVGVAMDTSAKTWAAFNALRRFGVDFGHAHFLCDYHNAKGDLVDTIAIRKSDFVRITRETVKSESYYRRYDQQYWKDAKTTHKQEAKV